MSLSHIASKVLFYALSLSIGFAPLGCHSSKGQTTESLPVLGYEAEDVARLSSPATIQKDETAQAWNAALVGPLRASVATPNAIETRLLKEDRDIWKGVLKQIEAYSLERKEAVVLSNLQIAQAVSCDPPVSAFSLRQRAQIQLTLQMRRNAFWRLGRLEMATNGVFHALQGFVSQFQTGHIKGSESAIVDPIKAIAQQINDLRKNQPNLKGDWNPGALHPRMARTAHAAPIFLQARSAFVAWQSEAARSTRYEYLAESAVPVVEALDAWIAEYDDVIVAMRHLSEGIQDMERVFSPPHAFVAYPCIGTNMRRLRILAQIYSHVLAMQWSLTKASDSAQVVLRSVKSPRYATGQNEYLADEIATFRRDIADKKEALTRAEDKLLAAWDSTSKTVWGSLSVFVDPIHHHAMPAVENAHIWQEMYKNIVAELNEIIPQIGAEPPQPINRRGKPHAPYIDSVIDTLHAPARIDDVERSLLAISELEAHMRSIRDELLRLCKQGACSGFPEAEISDSPRQSAWVVSWRQSPSQERTLGHSLVVIKLCQLHLSRLVQRLAEIYAWFAETSNADLSWKKLKSWQRIWTLYAEPNGTYATFLRSVADLSLNIAAMGKPHKTLAQSPALVDLLRLQSEFFDITVDYARFIDAKNPPPISFDELLATWDEIDAALVKIQTMTHESMAQQEATP